MGPDGVSPYLASQAYHLMQTHNFIAIIQVEFRSHPFFLEVIFFLVSFLHRVRTFKSSSLGIDRYSYLTLFSSEALSLACSTGQARGWFLDAFRIIQSMAISPEFLPPFRYSLDAPYHLFPSRQEMNQAIISERKYTDCILKLLRPHLPRPWDEICISIQRNYFSYVMELSSIPHTHIDTGCIHSGCLWANYGLALIDSEWRLITTYLIETTFARCATYRNWKWSCTSISHAVRTLCMSKINSFQGRVIEQNLARKYV